MIVVGVLVDQSTEVTFSHRDHAVQAWLAAHELVEERCTLAKGRVPRFKVGELRSLVGSRADEHLRASLRRLRTCGLLCWSETKLRFVQSTDEVKVGTAEDLQATLQRVPNHRRRVPVPRRFLVHLCGTRSSYPNEEGAESPACRTVGPAQPEAVARASSELGHLTKAAALRARR